jgi:hypothetical protein
MSTSGTTLMTLLNEVDDPRRSSNGTLHDFQEIRVIAICAVLSDADNVDDFAAWDSVKEDGFRPGPSHSGIIEAWDDDTRANILGIQPL